VNAKTPGQVNYEAFTAVRYNGSLTTAWTSPAIAHKAWESAAAAVLAPVTAELRELTAGHERLLATGMTPDAIRYHAEVAADRAILRGERDELRALAEGLYAALAIGGQDSDDVRRSALGILQRAGIGWQPPAIETAGTEHLAAQITEGRQG
jgi:hypothetical protein